MKQRVDEIKTIDEEKYYKIDKEEKYIKHKKILSIMLFQHKRLCNR